MKEPRGNWYLLTGVIIGLALGLVYAWVISPVKYVDTNPAALADSSKETYRKVIALAYQSDHNLERARERLKLLDQANPVQVLAAQAQRMIAAKQPAQEARALAVLAADLGKPGGSGTAAGQVVAASQAGTATIPPSPLATLAVDQGIFTPTVPPPTALPTAAPSPTITLTPRPTFTIRPTATMIPTLSAPFKLTSKRSVCDSSARPGMIEIQANDTNAKPLPGVRIQVTWQDGESVFYTGLAPEINPGFADFSMAPGVVYSIKIGEASSAITGISLQDGCEWQIVAGQAGS